MRGDGRGRADDQGPRDPHRPRAALDDDRAVLRGDRQEPRSGDGRLGRIRGGVAMAGGAQLDRQGHRLIQLGVILFLLTSLEGLFIESFPVPTLGRSVHTLAAMSGVVLIALGIIWPRLRLGRASAAIAFCTLLY